MKIPSSDGATPSEMTERMRLRTLILLRWMAIVGQLAAITVKIDRVTRNTGTCGSFVIAPISPRTIFR